MISVLGWVIEFFFVCFVLIIERLIALLFVVDAVLAWINHFRFMVMQQQNAAESSWDNTIVKNNHLGLISVTSIKFLTVY